jgi:hypothetical protein
LNRQRLREEVFRWRYLVLAAELSLAAAFAFTGWQLLHQLPGPAVVETTTGRGPAPAPSSSPLDRPIGGMPIVPREAARTFRFPLTGDLVGRVNRDDYRLYGEQWRIVRILTGAMRTYIEQRVIPSLLTSARKEAKW